MLNIQLGRIHCRISLLFPAVLLLLLIGDKTGVACYSVLASLLHEMGHLLTMYWFNREDMSLTVSYYGIRMTTSTVAKLDTVKRLAVFAAGPIMNIVAGILIIFANGDKVCVLIQALIASVNLLPILPLDGGHIVLSVLQCVVSCERAFRIARLVSFSTLAVMVLSGIYMWLITGANFTLLAMSVYVATCLLFYKGN